MIGNQYDRSPICIKSVEIIYAGERGCSDTVENYLCVVVMLPMQSTVLLLRSRQRTSCIGPYFRTKIPFSCS